MRIVALLPMKAHSSRVPGKNFRDIAGKPLFRWILESLLETDFVDQVMINTDARERLEALDISAFGTRVTLRDRRPGLCGDEVSMNRIIEDDVAHCPSDVYLMTHTTNPAISAATLNDAFALYRRALEAGSADSLFSVNRFQTRFYREDGSPINHDPDNLIPTQDLEPWYEENSCFYFFTGDSFRRTQARIGERPILFETPPLESADIDEPADWRLAELLLEASRR